MCIDEPTKHGHWIKDPKSLWPLANCSVCKRLCVGADDYSYCPYCGAKMDKEAENKGKSE